MDLQSLTYTSVAGRALDDGELERILYSAQTNNALDGITGFLLFNGHAFLQVLEGVGPAIDDVMGRIRADQRHRDVTVVDDRSIEGRAFPDWTMGFLRLSGLTENGDMIERALRRDTPEPVKARLIEMARTLKTAA